jgi:hypothetical protein
MNSQINLTAAKVRRIVLIIALVICPLLTFQTGFAQSVATATLTSGGMNSITIGQNQQFTLTLGVTTNFISSGYSVLYSIGGGGANFFGIPNVVPATPPHTFTPRTNLNPIFNDPTVSDGQAFNGPGGFARFTFGLGGNSNQFDLGYTGDQFNNQPAGTFNLQSLVFNALNAPVGTYTIFLDSRSIMVDRFGPPEFNDIPMGGVTGPQFTVNVIPEPATIGLALVGGGMLLVAGWRRRRASV